MKYDLHCMANYKNRNLKQNKKDFNKNQKGNFQANSKQGISKKWGKYEQIQITG